MIRWLCGIIGHALIRLPAPERQQNLRCLCGMIDYLVPNERFE